MGSADTELTFYAADTTIVVGVGESDTVTIDGVDVTLEVIGANTDSSEATVKVNGETNQVAKGDTVTAGGTSVYINEIFLQTIPTESVQVEFFVGSDKVVIQEDTNWNTVEVDGDDLDGVEARITPADIDAIDTIEFRFVPADMEDDSKSFIEIGEVLTDPLFGTLKIDFDSVTPALDSSSKESIEVKRSSDDCEIVFSNREGDEFSVTPYTGTGSAVTIHADWWDLDTAEYYDNVTEGKIIVLQEGTSAASYITKIYEVYDIDAADEQITLRDLSDGSKFVVDTTEEIGDTGAYVCGHLAADTADTTIDTTQIDLMNASTCDGSGTDALIAVDNTFYTEHDVLITVNDIAASAGAIDFAEAQANNNDETTATTLSVAIESDSSNDIKINTLTSSGGTFASVQDDDGDVEYGVTEFGTYVELEVDDDGAYFYLWVPVEEQDFNLFFAPTEATVLGGASGDVDRSGVIKSNIAVVDTAVTSTQKSNYHLILGGGPAVNKLTAEALDLDFPTYGADSGIPEDGYMISLVEDAFVEGMYALVIAGWEASNTAAAMSMIQANMADATGMVYYYPEAPA